MKIIVMIIALLFGCQTKNTTNNEWPWNALLIENQKPINVFTTSESHEVKYTIMNDTVNEEYMLIEILQKEGTLFKIKSASAFNDSIKSEGWINNKHVGIYLRSREISGSVPLYNSPKDNSSYTDINGNRTELMRIIDIKNGWLKIEFNENGLVKEGWIKKENQCPNPYSTCN